MYYITFGGINWLVYRKCGTFIPILLCVTKMVWVVEVRFSPLYLVYRQRHIAPRFATLAVLRVKKILCLALPTLSLLSEACYQLLSKSTGVYLSKLQVFMSSSAPVQLIKLSTACPYSLMSLLLSHGWLSVLVLSFVFSLFSFI